MNQARVDLSTIDDVLKHFHDCFTLDSFVPVTLAAFTTDDCQLLKPGMSIPHLSPTMPIPDLLRVKLPDHFPSSVHADAVVEMLKTKRVFGPAVSGAGKVCAKRCVI
jgi:hypothetical protein